MASSVFEYLPKVVLPGDVDNKFKFRGKVHFVWEECEWMVKYKLECDTLECVCGAVFEAWVASGRGEREEWLESTSEAQVSSGGGGGGYHHHQSYFQLIILRHA